MGHAMSWKSDFCAKTRYMERKILVLYVKFWLESVTNRFFAYDGETVLVEPLDAVACAIPAAPVRPMH
jgi:hypothetical protein